MDNCEKTKICLLQKIISSVMGVFYLGVFIECMISVLSPGKPFGMIWVLPAAVLVLLHIIIIFKKKLSFKYMFITILIDFLVGVSPFLVFGFDVYLLISQFMIPLVVSLVEFVTLVYKIFNGIE